MVDTHNIGGHALGHHTSTLHGLICDAAWFERPRIFPSLRNNLPCEGDIVHLLIVGNQLGFRSAGLSVNGTAGRGKTPRHSKQGVKQWAPCKGAREGEHATLFWVELLIDKVSRNITPVHYQLVRRSQLTTTALHTNRKLRFRHLTLACCLVFPSVRPSALQW